MSRPQPVYSAAQWEQHKETIRRLYRDEEKTLDDVAATMARDFDFHATYVSSPPPRCVLTYRPQLQKKAISGQNQ